MAKNDGSCSHINPVDLRSNALITRKLNYIYQNSAEEVLVFHAED
jgi:hypothetical protein